MAGLTSWHKLPGRSAGAESNCDTSDPFQSGGNGPAVGQETAGGTIFGGRRFDLADRGRTTGKPDTAGPVPLREWMCCRLASWRPVCTCRYCNSLVTGDLRRPATPQRAAHFRFRAMLQVRRQPSVFLSSACGPSLLRYAAASVCSAPHWDRRAVIRLWRKNWWMRRN